MDLRRFFGKDDGLPLEFMALLASGGGGGASDTIPTAFSFTDATGVALSTVTESNQLTLAGTDALTAITITGGEYQIGAGSWVSTGGTIAPGALFKVRGTSSASTSTAVNVVLTIGGVSDTFTITTSASGGATLTAPVITRTSSAGTNPPTISVQAVDDPGNQIDIELDYFEFQADDNNSFSSPLHDKIKLTLQNYSDLTASLPSLGGFASGGAFHGRGRWRRYAEADPAVVYSPWSNTISDTLAAPVVTAGWNVAAMKTTLIASNSNRTITAGEFINGPTGAKSVTGHSGTGDWYAEVDVTVNSGTHAVGVAVASFDPVNNPHPRDPADKGVVHYEWGGTDGPGAAVADGASWTTAKMGIRFVGATRVVTFYKNGVVQNSKTVSGAEDVHVWAHSTGAGAVWTINTGHEAFTSPPSGVTAWG